MTDAPSPLGYLEVLNHAPVGVCVIQQDYRVVFWNRCLEDWTHIPAQEIVGTDIGERFPHFRQPKYTTRFATIFAGGAPTIFSSQFHRYVIPALLPNGEPRIQQTTVTAIPDPAGDGFLALLAIEDVTELTRRIYDYRYMRDQALEEIRQREKAEKDKLELQSRMQRIQKFESLAVLTGGIAHDFNNLLAVVLGNTDLALLELSEDHAARSSVEAAEEAARRAAKLVNQMLAIAGKGKSELNDTDLSQQVRKMAPLLGAAVNGDTRLVLDLQDNLPLVAADCHQLQQVVLNLVMNASEALEGQAGDVHIRTGVAHIDPEDSSYTYLSDEVTAGDYVYLEIRDTGCGMDSEMIARIFDPFFTTRFTGRGLGLPAVLGIVRGHRGVMRVESVEGEGSHIAVCFPVAPGNISGAGAVTEKNAATSSILVIDSDDAMRTMACDVLTASGYHVVAARDATEGVELFSESDNSFQLIILDAGLRDMTAKEVFRAIYHVDRDARVVLAVDCEEGATSQSFTDKRLAGFVQKPYESADLVTKVQSFLDS